MNQDLRFYWFYTIKNNITGKYYVGITVNADARKSKHFGQLERGVHHSEKLQRSYAKHGKEAFGFAVVEIGLFTEDEAIKREAKLIAKFDAFHNGYNMHAGGNIGDLSAKPVTWNNKTYSSATEAARVHGVNAGTMAQRIRLGYTCDADVSLPGGGIPCEWEGVSYPSVKIASDVTGIPYAAILQRIEKGYKSEADMPFSSHRFKPVVWEGREYESIKAFAEANGLTYKSAAMYIEFGYTCFADISRVGGHKKKPIVWEGKEYISIRQCAEAVGISHTTIRRRLAKLSTHPTQKSA